MEYVTVRELKEILNNVEDDAIVVLSSDSEGNSFSPLDNSVGIDNYEPNENDRGEVYPRELTEELIKMGWTESNLGEDKEKLLKCITLFPCH